MSVNKHNTNAMSINKHNTNTISINKYNRNAMSVNKHNRNAMSVNKHNRNAMSINKHNTNAMSVNKHNTNTMSINKYNRMRRQPRLERDLIMSIYGGIPASTDPFPITACPWPTTHEHALVSRSRDTSDRHISRLSYRPCGMRCNPCLIPGLRRRWVFFVSYGTIQSARLPISVGWSHSSELSACFDMCAMFGCQALV